MMGEPSSNGCQREVAVAGVVEVVRREGAFDGVGTGFHGWEIRTGEDTGVAGIGQEMGGGKGRIAHEHVDGVNRAHVAILGLMVRLVNVVGQGGEGRGRDAGKEAVVQRWWLGRGVGVVRGGGSVGRREEERGSIVSAIIAV
jgi:hypothetical protein